MSKRILVIDDRQELLALIRMLLEDAEYGVSVLDDGSLVEETARKNPPDLIVLEMTDADVVEQLIHDPSGRYANVSVLKKPFDGDVLLERIQSMIGVAEAG
jgi:CheY-like chemotaxis protein